VKTIPDASFTKRLETRRLVLYSRASITRNPTKHDEQVPLGDDQALARAGFRVLLNSTRSR
jgi:hypothetical protein